VETVSDERVLFESEDRSLTVTTHRVRLMRRGFGRTGRIASLLLEDLDGIEFGREARPIFLQLAVVALVLGVATAIAVEDEEAFLVLGLFPAILLTSAYFVVRKRGLRLHAGRLTLGVPGFRGGVLAAESLMDAIERARLERANAKPVAKDLRFSSWSRERPSESEAAPS
jgi:hypothetical protein